MMHGQKDIMLPVALSTEHSHKKLGNNQIIFYTSVAYLVYMHAIKRLQKEITKGRNKISDSSMWIQNRW